MTSSHVTFVKTAVERDRTVAFCPLVVDVPRPAFPLEAEERGDTRADRAAGRDCLRIRCRCRCRCRCRRQQTPSRPTTTRSSTAPTNPEPDLRRPAFGRPDTGAMPSPGTSSAAPGVPKFARCGFRASTSPSEAACIPVSTVVSRAISSAACVSASHAGIAGDRRAIGAPDWGRGPQDGRRAPPANSLGRPRVEGLTFVDALFQGPAGRGLAIAIIPAASAEESLVPSDRCWNTPDTTRSRACRTAAGIPIQSSV
jgi:hypothetical protein